MSPARPPEGARTLARQGKGSPVTAAALGRPEQGPTLSEGREPFAASGVPQ